MKTILLLLFSLGYAAAQSCGTLVFNPLTRRFDCIGSSSSTGLTSASVGNSGGIPYFTGANRAMGSTATWTADTLMKGGGAGVSPVVTGITVDGSDNLSSPGSAAFGVGSGVAGSIGFTQGTAPSAGTTNITMYAPAAVTSYIWRLPGAAATGFYLGTNTAGDVVTTQVAASGTGSVCLTVSCAMTTPNLGTPSAATLTNATGLPIVAGTTGTLTVARGGTGATTLTGVLKGNGTSAVDVVSGSASDCVKVDGTSGSCGSGGGSVGGGISVFSANLTPAGTVYYGVGGGLSSSTEADVSVKASGAMSATNLQVSMSVAPGMGNNIVLTLRVAGSDSALTCTIADVATSCQDITHTVAIAQDEVLSIKAVASTTLSATNLTAMIQFGTGVQDPGANGLMNRTALNTTAAITTSAGLAAVISDETGSGALVLATSPTLVTPALGTPSALVLTNATGLPNSAATNSLRDYVFGATFDGGGSALTGGTTTARYITLPAACTIVAWDISVDAGTATFKTWRVASGTAIPTNGDSISTSGVAISSGTSVHSTTVTDWTDTTLDANDIIGLNLSAVATATLASFQITCRK